MSLVSERYAQALFQITEKNSSSSSIQETLSEVGRCLEEEPQIQNLFFSPLVSNTEKLGMLKSVFSGQNETLNSFLSVLAKNNRLGSLPGIAKAYSLLVNQASGTMTGEVTSAAELSQEEKSNLQQVIESELGKKVTLQYKIDPKMIGGVEARVGSFIFEDSIKSHMQQLNEFITRRVQ